MRRSLALAATLSLCLLAPAVASANAALETGLADDDIVLKSPSVAADYAADWAAAGVDDVRVHVGWREVSPAPSAALPPRDFHPSDPSAYDLAALDRAVRVLREHGLHVTLGLWGPAPVWASQDPSRKDGRWKPSPGYFRAFATAVARHFADDVDRYEIWNEPNHPLWLMPQRSGGALVAPHLYRALVAAATPAIHDADPGATVLMGALAPSGSDSRSGGAAIRPLAFLRSMACVDSRYRTLRSGSCRGFKAPDADAFSLHPHGIKLSPDAHARSHDDAPIGDLGHFEAVLDKLTRAHRLKVDGGAARFPLYLTEFAYQTNPPDPFLGVSLATQAAWLSRSAQKAMSDPRVRSLTWYVWKDGPLGRNGSGWQSGVLRADGTAKPSLTAFRLPFVASTKSVWGMVRPGADHAVTVEGRARAGAWRTLTTLQTGATGGFSRRLAVPRDVREVRAVAGDGTTSLALKVR
jgi:hypothetical protein